MSQIQPGEAVQDAERYHLTAKALEIVFQHWMIPSTNLQNWDGMTTELEIRLPQLKTEIVNSRLARMHFNSNRNAVADPSTVQLTRENLDSALANNPFCFDLDEVESLQNNLRAKSIIHDWIPRLPIIEVEN